MNSLLSSLQHFARGLKEDTTMRLTDEEMEAVTERVIEVAPRRTGTPIDVALVPVHTYVHQMTKSSIPGTSPSIIVPTFACHWGIVVGEEDDQKLFHLLFIDDAELDASSSTVENRNIRFHATNLYKPLRNAKYVGHTHYSNDELEALGKAMIREFESYHKLFWNCQAFAKCYLRVVTGEVQAKFDD
jgi:hypothetical protein